MQTPKEHGQEQQVKLFVAEEIDREEELIEKRIAERLNPEYDSESPLNQVVHR